MERVQDYKLTTRYQVWVVVLLFASTFINGVDRASLSSAAPVLMKDLNIDSCDYGYDSICFLLAICIAQYPSWGFI